jgi:hypothetical protein
MSERVKVEPLQKTVGVSRKTRAEGIAFEGEFIELAFPAARPLKIKGRLADSTIFDKPNHRDSGGSHKCISIHNDRSSLNLGFWPDQQCQFRMQHWFPRYAQLRPLVSLLITMADAFRHRQVTRPRR